MFNQRKQIIMSVISITLLLLLSLSAAGKDKPKENLADADIKKAIIAESIASYPGNCPCPYSRARNGSSCGKRSAWSRQGGYAPICYENEVSEDLVRQWRTNHGQSK